MKRRFLCGHAQSIGLFCGFCNRPVENYVFPHFLNGSLREPFNRLKNSHFPMPSIDAVRWPWYTILL